MAAGHLGRYELLARLAAGGMGEIFLARLGGAEGFQKLYVVKRILPHLASDPRFRKMLIAEAQIASKMAHSNICQVYELGETDGQLFIVMEYLEGVSLLSLMRRRSRSAEPLALGFVGGVFAQVCDALHYAHELRDRAGNSLGVIHRDVTPANVFVTEGGAAKVLDFGIAKMNDSSSTQTDSVKGKYAYMAPEQLRGAKLTRRVDVFALGVVLFEMLALRRLFQRRTDFLTFSAVMEQPIADLRRYREDVPEGVVSAVMRALEREPANRFETVRALRDAVVAALPAADGPWGTEEIGAWVREHFADEIGRTSAAVARSIDRTKTGGPPDWLANEAPIAAEVPVNAEEDTEFPPVETELDPPRTGDAAWASAGRTPAAATSPAAPRARGRGAVLVVLALAVLGGGAALAFEVWPRNPPSPTVDASFVPKDRPKEVENRKALTPYLSKLGLCTGRYPSTQESMTASILIGTDGKASGPISFSPAELDGTPLTECLGKVLHDVQFPTRIEQSLYLLDINLPRRSPRGTGAGSTDSR